MKFTGWRQNDFKVQGYRRPGPEPAAARGPAAKVSAHERGPVACQLQREKC
jgi:hypothetical protein